MQKRYDSEYVPITPWKIRLKKVLTRIYVECGSAGYTVKWISNKYNFKGSVTMVYSKVFDFLIEKSLPVNPWLQNREYVSYHINSIIKPAMYWEYGRDLLIGMTRSIDDLKKIYTLCTLFLVHGYVHMSDFPFKDLADISERTLVMLSAKGNYRLFDYICYGENVIMLLSHCRTIGCDGWFDIMDDELVQDKDGALRKLIAEYIVKEGL